MKPWLLALPCILLAATSALADEPRAADGDEVVLRRLYPKTHTVELEAGIGHLLNPTYVDTLLLQASVRYHWSEAWGLGVAFAAARTQDRPERTCVESFYNDPLRQAGAVCAAQDGGAALAGAQSLNIGPAYPRIRELTGIAGVFGDYTLAYGKQILLHGVTSHFDLRLRFGAAAVLSKVYPERDHVRGNPNRPSRGDPDGENGAPRAGVGIDERDADGLLYGIEGRPEAVAETAPSVFLAVAQEMHFARRFFVLAELAAYALPADDRGLETFFVINLGGGVRL